MPKLEIIDPGWSYSTRYTFSPAVRNGLLLQGSFVTTAAPEANGGDITVTAQNGAVRLTDSHISAEVNQEEGQGGNVTITAAAVILERSQVLTRAGPGTGGDITIAGGLSLMAPSSPGNRVRQIQRPAAWMPPAE
jgi:hypothetical protein